MTPAGLTVDEQERAEDRAYKLALVVYLLQSLHVLFGITAVIGMLINHTNNHNVAATFAESHFKWQKMTFWLAALAYALSFYLWLHYGWWQALVLVLLWVTYRIIRGWWQLVARHPITSSW